MPTFTYRTWSDEADDFVDVHLPGEYIVCQGRCRGSGRQDVWDGGMTASEMYEQGEDFIDDYMAGHYSKPCEDCGGDRVQLVPDEEACDPDALAAYHKHCQDEWEANAADRSEAAYFASFGL